MSVIAGLQNNDDKAAFTLPFQKTCMITEKWQVLVRFDGSIKSRTGWKMGNKSQVSAHSEMRMKLLLYPVRQQLWLAAIFQHLWERSGVPKGGWDFHAELRAIPVNSGTVGTLYLQPIVRNVIYIFYGKCCNIGYGPGNKSMYIGKDV